MSALGKLLINLKTKWSLRKKTTFRGSRAYLEAQSFGVLFTESDDKTNVLIRGFVSDLEAEGKVVKSLTYIPKVKNGIEPDYPFFTGKDFSSKGNWKKEEVEVFTNESFDFLINMDTQVNKSIRNIMATSKAKCRVGWYDEETSNLFEMMVIKEGDNFKECLGVMHKYLKNVRND
ncbi:MAG: hypothetical protein OCD76_14710 [Reichenbachiella sp.]